MSFFLRKNSMREKSMEQLAQEVVVEEQIIEEPVEAVDTKELERQRVLRAWVKSQKVDFDKISDTDDTSKGQLVLEFNWIISQGLSAKQHIAGVDNPFQIFIRLHENGNKLVWAGGVANSWSGAREVDIASVTLVSTGLGSAGFRECSSSKRFGVDPAACLSLVLPYSFLGSQPHSLDLELASATECAAIAYGFSLVTTDGHSAEFLGMKSPSLLESLSSASAAVAGATASAAGNLGL
mmetsp:Transcript_35436/g.72227  ORF Transcript_35436/g.72227 Transcript_35436/m.72227 type:complete len:238 (-) Transcript_35436:348-1061(-)